MFYSEQCAILPKKAGDFQIPCFFYRYGFPFMFTGFQRCKKGVNFKSCTLNPLVFQAFQNVFSILPWQTNNTLIIVIKPRFFQLFLYLLFFLTQPFIYMKCKTKEYYPEQYALYHRIAFFAIRSFTCCLFFDYTPLENRNKFCKK